MARREKIVFLRVGALGDLLVSLSALEAVLRKHPGQEIAVVGPALWLDILRPFPHWNIGAVYVLTGKYGLDEFRRKEDWYKTGISTSFYQLCRESAVLYNLRFESLRYSWHAYFARVPVRYGSSPRFFRFLFTHWFGWLGMEPPIHERDWTQAIVEAPASSARKYRGWRYNRHLLKKKYEALPFEIRNREGLPAMALPRGAPQIPGKYVLVNPTASRRDKAWPAENFRMLSAFLSARLGHLTVITIGSPGESAWLAEASGDTKIVQPQNLAELFGIVRGAAALITNTSSMQFIASATGTPTLTLMGWADPVRWGPLGAGNLVIRGIPSTHPNIFERDEESYRSITVEKVQESALAWLRAKDLPR